MNGNASLKCNNDTVESESTPVVLQLHTAIVHCIFCAKECQPNFTVVDGTLIRIKGEGEAPQEFVERQMGALFIFKEILQVREAIVHKLLKEFNGQLHPEFWVKVCNFCQPFVDESRAACVEIARLERGVKEIQSKLKGFILVSEQNDDELEIDSMLWKEIREEAVKGFQEPPTSPGRQEVLVHDADAENHMFVEVGPVFQVKQEALTPHQPLRNKSNPKCKQRIPKAPKVKRKIKRKPLKRVGAVQMPSIQTGAEISSQDRNKEVKNHERNTTTATTDEPEPFEVNNPSIFSVNEEAQERIPEFGRSMPARVMFDSIMAQIWRYKLLTKLQADRERESSSSSQSDEAASSLKVTETQPRVQNEDDHDTDQDFQLIPITKIRTSVLKYEDKWSLPAKVLAVMMSPPPTPEISHYECTKCPGERIWPYKTDEHRKWHAAKKLQELKDLSDPKYMKRAKNSAPKDHVFKCKQCSALMKTEEESTKHLQLHKDGSELICLACGWLVENICEHNENWHSEETQEARSWALTPYFWVVEDSPPDYTLYRQEYINKYKCKRCPAQVFKLAEIVEHKRLHVEERGTPCTSCKWLVAPGKMVEHEKRYHFPAGVGASTSKLPVKEVVYFECPECGATCLHEDKEVHQILHRSWGADCEICGIFVKNLQNHKNYFHSE